MSQGSETENLAVKIKDSLFMPVMHDPIYCQVCSALEMAASGKLGDLWLSEAILTAHHITFKLDDKMDRVWQA